MRVCSIDSTAQGPATMASSGPPTGTAADVHDAVLGLDLARDELVGVGDGDHLEHAGQALEDGRLQRALVPGHADRGALRARDGMGLEAAGLDGLDHAPDLVGGGVLAHDHEHVNPPDRGQSGAPEPLILATPRKRHAGGANVRYDAPLPVVIPRRSWMAAGLLRTKSVADIEATLARTESGGGPP